jgi:hypothetical protein
VINDPGDKPKRVAKSLDYARRKLPYLSDVVDQGVDPDYTIELSVHYETQSSNEELAGATLFMIPGFISEEVSVVAKVMDSEHRELGIFRASGTIKQVVQLHLVYILPVMAPVSVHMERGLWNKTVRDALIQSGEAIAQDQRAVVPTGGVGGASASGEYSQMSQIRSVRLFDRR